MSQITTTPTVSIGRVTQSRQAIGGVRFDWVAALLAVWLLSGLFLDGWAHNTGQVESFFTPWHAVLYSSVLANGLFLALNLVRNVAQGYAWRQALPAGYGLPLLGVALFALSGAGDMIWHGLFGIEEDFEALYSPTHLMLAVSGVMMISGPLRAARNQVKGEITPTWKTQMPLLITVTAIFSLLTFFTQDMHWMLGIPGLNEEPQTNTEFFYGQIAGLAAILLQAGIMMGIVLLAIRRWQLVPGALTFILGANALLMTTQHPERDDWLALVAAVVVAGLLADGFRARWQPDVTRPGALRFLAFALPAVTYLLYFLILIMAEGTWWSVHLWTGAIVLAGMVGLLLSYLQLPLPAPSD
ncbi:MAG: hypothetical protein L0332_03690 [Chloroflexi bacterium]|nr:hypothetical protein [Chloroflexota bacterium]MCI0579420.1 hypothetical protein [Chloroflexota bacterium]MCI0725815.1 hypothetical protein [Chloroflexota bacterium]